jgi:hypothetical protein
MKLPIQNNQRVFTQVSRSSSYLFFFIVIFFTGIYLYNISGWLIHGDEGTDLYEVWQLQIGNQPGVDFIAEQQPLFLLLGKTVLGFTDNSVQAVKLVRLVSALQVLAGSIFLGLVVKHLWDAPAASLMLGLTLTSGLIYEQARLFRPDPMMFAWELFGFGFVLLAVKLGKRPYWAAAGVAYGIAVLMKLFGLFPVAGLAIFFLYLFISQKAQSQKHLFNGLAFAIPFLLVSGGVSLLLYSQMGFYYQEAFNQHLSLGQEKSVWEQIFITISTYLSFFLVNAIYVFIVPLAILNWRSKESVLHFSERILIYTQLIVPFFFIFITRPIYTRYFIFLLPAAALLLIFHLKGFFNKIDSTHPKAQLTINLLIVLIIGFSLFATFPSITNRLIRQEDGTIALAQYIQTLTDSNDVVVSDYASLNFHAKRQSIYEASIIAGGRIKGGIVTGALLIEKMEAREANLVLIHVEGGYPDHLIHLIDFEIFEAYLQKEYQLIEVYNRAGQLIEIYQRK